MKDTENYSFTFKEQTIEFHYWPIILHLTVVALKPWCFADDDYSLSIFALYHIYMFSTRG